VTRRRWTRRSAAPSPAATSRSPRRADGSSWRFRQPGLLRSLRAAELSDGTLRYLLWAAALLTPRPPELLVLNGPETSLHPDLTGPLAGLITAASASTQIIVVTHARPLVTAFGDSPARVPELVKEDGRTLLDGQGILDEPAWHWPGR
jgi:predicted ATPase